MIGSSRKPERVVAPAFIEIQTDTELIGIGETYAGYFLPESVPAIVEFFRPISGPISGGRRYSLGTHVPVRQVLVPSGPWHFRPYGHRSGAVGLAREDASSSCI